MGFIHFATLHFRPVTAESLFELGSTTKAVTALAEFLLQNQGTLAYTDDVLKYLPGFASTSDLAVW
ncbi:serine hydrolase domain-containing protein [Paenibacillus sp. FSL H3-0469]|uniref:serine hydrolase domain-containing protein n=1 Tax=Paenibacillus sp. FSL H3-0469 TaxID=2954506 RepID=UPI003101A3D8